MATLPAGDFATLLPGDPPRALVTTSPAAPTAAAATSSGAATISVPRLPAAETASRSSWVPLPWPCPPCGFPRMLATTMRASAITVRDHTLNPRLGTLRATDVASRFAEADARPGTALAPSASCGKVDPVSLTQHSGSALNDAPSRSGASDDSGKSICTSHKSLLLCLCECSVEQWPSGRC